MTSWANDTAIIGLVPPGVCAGLEVISQLVVPTYDKLTTYHPEVNNMSTCHRPEPKHLNADPEATTKVTVSVCDFVGTATLVFSYELTISLRGRKLNR